MAQLTLRNRSLKVSPGGVVTLPTAARKALGMQPGAGARVTVAVNGDTVELRPAGADGGFRVSPKGQMELRGDAFATLSKNTRNYWLEIDDDKELVLMRPFT